MLGLNLKQVLLYVHFDSSVLHLAVSQSDMTIIIFYVKPWRRVPHLLWLKAKNRGILVHPAVPAVPAVILHLQAVDDCSFRLSYAFWSINMCNYSFVPLIILLLTDPSCAFLLCI